MSLRRFSVTLPRGAVVLPAYRRTGAPAHAQTLTSGSGMSASSSSIDDLFSSAPRRHEEEEDKEEDILTHMLLEN